MNFSTFFIDRPIFAGVLSLFIFIAGSIAVWQLPVSEYPAISPPSIQVSASYPGANPKTISETVAAPLEEQINGVEGMLYMASQANTDGALSITVTFKLGMDPDKAQQLVQNRVSQALPRLPDAVRTIGVTTVKSSPDLTMVVHLESPNGRYDGLYLSNYALLNVKDELSRIDGVGQAMVFGAGEYAMRIWLDPQKAAARNISANDVINAIREQNIQVAAGVIGASPMPESVDFELPILAEGRLNSPEEFGEIIVKTDDNGGITYLRDLARIELGASGYSLRSLLNNKEAGAVAIFQMSDANALQISQDVRTRMEEISKNFPEDVEYSIVYDPTVFVSKSIDAVITTLLEAVALVVIVVVIFLQTWRASVIPLLAVPVSIVGTFAFMYMFGFTINTLTLFGLVLAIGIVVDDAIVVVENVERNIENGLAPREATYQAMREVSGPIIAIALTLCAVFIPIAFIPGLTGQFYKQFALTIAISTVISAFNSLTLSPALSALLLKSHDAKPDPLTRLMDSSLGWFFNGFNKVFTRASRGYSRSVNGMIKAKVLILLVYVALIGATVYMFERVPQGYVPTQDKQYLIAFTQLPGGASLERTDKVIRQMSEIMLQNPGVEDAVAFPGLSIAGFSNAPNAGIVFAGLKPFEERTTPELSAMGIVGDLNQKFAGIKEGFIAVFPPPAVPGLGAIGGFKLQVQDRTGHGDIALSNAVNAVVGQAYQTPELAGVFSSFQTNVPQLQVGLDRVKARQLNVPITDVYSTMQLYLGSLYVNDFNQFGRTFRVVAQADAPYRSHPEDITQLKVRNLSGEMVPLGSLVTVRETNGPDKTMRYNAFRTADISGDAGPGYSSGQAEAAIEKILQETLPQGMTYEWTDLTYQQILAGDSGKWIFPMCVLFVFLVLSAQYESLSIPLAVILIVPMCLLSAIIGVDLAGKTNNIFTQIGFVVLVGLACKNAILIVEFARELEMQGKSIVDAAIEACHLRLRPILMTSFAFIMGVVPLVLSTGAGAEIRTDMGVAVFSGMLGVTVFGLILTPVFYVVIRTLATWRTKA